ncbi:MAG: hypothetical protein D6766_05525, partial [Verrucomicrobia bacterium]
RGLGEDIRVDTPWTGSIVDRSFFTDPRYAPYRQPGRIKVPFWLTPRKYYVGPAWYRRPVDVPKSWRNQRLVLRLERPHWGTTVWWDDRRLGSQDSLSTPHVYELPPGVTPGRHWLTVRVDNRMLVPVGRNSHSISDHTQGNWNGLVGRLELLATPPVWIEDLQVFPDVTRRAVRVRLKFGNRTGREAAAVLRLEARSETSPPHEPPPVEKKLRILPVGDVAEVDLPLGPHARLWDEFAPNVYCLTATLVPGDEPTTRHQVQTTFGLREIGREGTQFTINGRRTFLRGTLECCVFPLTGHPPTDVDSWRRVFRVCRAHGLNHMRFHSWCPPEAAFQAADELGFYLHVECASWANSGTSLDDPKVRDFLMREADRILRAYGNHPSFCFLAYGNEPAGRVQRKWLGRFVTLWRQADPRRLYTSAAGWPIIPENDYHVTPTPRIQAWGAGLNSRINARPPETVTDYGDFIRRYDVPVVSHEIGQWCVYPNLKERAKYTGVMRAFNFDIFADSLAAHGMADLADEFLFASGKLQALCYKEEIESALRTPDMGGFQLLDLHDFPGQGTALVGVLDPFWDEKGYITAAEFRRFCNATVPLALLPKRVFTGGERLEARIRLAHFGPAPLTNAVVRWRLIETNGTALAEGAFDPRTIPLGNDTIAGTVRADLPAATRARQLRLEVAIADTPFANDWDLWLYPARQPELPCRPEVHWRVVGPEGIDAGTRRLLAEGARVFLHIPPSRVAGDEFGPVATGFSSIFWNTAWTRRQAPHTLGILVDPAHPAFREFPTESHSNWQWWYLIHGARAMILDPLPREAKPLIRMIDDWVTNRRLALAFEARVGRGRVLVSSMGLWPDGLTNAPRRQLALSLERYLASDAFQPEAQLSIEQLEALLQPPPAAERFGARVRRADSFHPDHPPKLALDGDPRTMWHTAWGDETPGFPHFLEIEFAKPAVLGGVRLTPRSDNNRNGWIKGYRIEVETAPGQWRTVAAGELPATARPQTVRFEPVEVRALRLTATSGHAKGPWTSLAELEPLPPPPDPGR